MKMRSITILAGVLAFAAALQAAETNVLRQVQNIPLPDVEGRIDHFGVDIQGQRLFVSALGNNTLEVLDLREGKRLTSITGLKEPQGVFFVRKVNKLFVANGDDGTCRVFDGSSYKPLLTVHFSSDATTFVTMPAKTRSTSATAKECWVSWTRPPARNLRTFRFEAILSHFGWKNRGQGFLSTCPRPTTPLPSWIV